MRELSRRVEQFRCRRRDCTITWPRPAWWALAGIDTRALVRRIRSRGAMKGVLSTVDLDDASLVAKARASRGLVGRDLVREVVPSESASLDECAQPLDRSCHDSVGADPASDGHRPHVVAHRLRHEMEHRPAFARSGLPGHGAARHGSTAEQVLEQKPDGVFLSNGPGDPEPLEYAIETIRGLLGKAPIFGICLGHQLLSLACGAKTFKLKFGHRGANQPVLNLRHRPRRDHCAEPRFCRRRGIAAGRSWKSRTGI